MSLIFNQTLIDQAIARSLESSRLRTNHNFHTDFSDPVQRFLNVIQPDSYIRPHRHEIGNAFETFIVLQGSLGICLFDDQGEVTESHLLDPKTGIHGIEIDGYQWHTVFALEENTVCFELKRGPYDPESAKEFAPWAPSEEDDKAFCYFNAIKHHFKESPSHA